MDLGGTWRARVADDELRRHFPLITLDDSDWDEITVPGHWRTTPAFESNDDAVLYRHRFRSPRPLPGQRAWLVLDGIFYQGDVWLDGAYLGDTEGYFTPHRFEITQALTADTEHQLAIEVACAAQRSRTRKRNLTGVFQHWDCIDPDWNPGGIWQPVHLEETGPVAIERLRVLCTEASQERAVLTLRAVLDADDATQVRVRSSVGADRGATLDEQLHTLARGSNRVEWTVVIERPSLWWPRSLGAPVLTAVHVEVLDPATGEVSDERVVRTGLRQIRRKDWVFEINGERLYLKGANLGPLRMAIGDVSEAEIRAELAHVCDLGLDLIRLHAHVTHPLVYDIADAMGLLIWQDMPLQWGYARSVRGPAMEQARDLVDLHGHHPSIIHWCGHNEPMALDVDPDAALGSPKKAAEMAGRYLALQELPTWNKTVLDHRIARVLTRSDPSRPVTAHSGVLPGPTSLGTDTHLYFGWYHGHERDLPRLLGGFPRLGRFVSEFGAQALPATDDFVEPSLWPDLDWERLGRDHALQRKFFDRNVAPAGFLTYDAWKSATQRHQSEVLRRHIEELRRIKYRPSGGFAFFLLADPLDHPAVSWSVLGHDRRPKPAYDAVRAACAPVIVVADRLPPRLHAGDTLNLDVHVVCDLRSPLIGATVTSELIWPGGCERSTWKGDVGVDAVVRVSGIDAVVGVDGPVTDPGEATLSLRLDHPALVEPVTNSYRAVFDAAPRPRRREPRRWSRQR